MACPGISPATVGSPPQARLQRAGIDKRPSHSRRLVTMRPFGQGSGDSGIRRLVADPAILATGMGRLPLKVAPPLAFDGAAPNHHPSKLRRQHGAAPAYALIWARRYRAKILVTDVVLILFAVLLCSQAVQSSPTLTWQRGMAVNVGISLTWLTTLWLCRTGTPGSLDWVPGSTKASSGPAAPHSGFWPWLSCLPTPTI